MKRRLAGLLALLVVASCVATYPQRGEDTAVRLTVENHYSGSGIVVVRVLCETRQIAQVRGLSLNEKRTIRLRGRPPCASSLSVEITDVTGRRVYWWSSNRIPASAGDHLGVTMGATLNLSSFYRLP